MSTDLLAPRARHHVADILRLAVEHTPAHRALIVSDAQSPLAALLTDAYTFNLPDAVHLRFDDVTPDVVMAAFAALHEKDLVVLIQSSSFRLNAFRIRVGLFSRHLKVIEHPHLGRMAPDEHAAYVESLAYDPAYYRVVGPALKKRIDQARHITVFSGGERLDYASTFEDAKLNVGDYSAMKNVGGQFPIGEVFTEPTDLEQVNGRVRIHAFGNTQFMVNVPPQPITLVIERGKVVDTQHSTPEFDAVLAQIRTEEDVWVRELGFGMNRAFTLERRVADIGTYERMCGIHMSLGAKHNTYNKPQMKRKEGRFHVDVFAVTQEVLVDGVPVYAAGGWSVPPEQESCT